jgi:Integrase core domain
MDRLLGVGRDGPLGIQHRFTRPYTPRTNGKAERFIQTALREWAYVRHYLNSEERDQHLSPWLEHYNFAKSLLNPLSSFCTLVLKLETGNCSCVYLSFA